MGKPTGFIEYPRETAAERPIAERVKDSREVYERFPEDRLKRQAARCMDCGVPFCHTGCPLGNIIPDFNDLAYRDQWRRAIDVLHATNNFPEFTGRICPAPCEEACVLGINEPPVTIEQIEKAIVEHAFAAGWIRPEPPETRTGKSVAVVGSGPAGLACAQQLNRAGHTVTVFERADRIGGLLRYGIPDFKLEKHVIDRRLKILEAEGITFKTKANIGIDIPADRLHDEFDAIVLCGGATKPRDLPIPGRELNGIHFAMDFLWRQNKRVAGDDLTAEGIELISAKDKHVIVIGGGDTGSDCIGTANRHGAKSITQFEILERPPEDRPPHQPWPYWPMKLRTSSSHREGVERHWSLTTAEFLGTDGVLRGLRTASVRFVPANGGRPKM
ncbi:MAG: glutamate synthase subunit beta, partial [Phycisphaerae bacterium]|nr:glutamate synthase subunit beta [Phycisphaerae bacterium]